MVEFIKVPHVVNGAVVSVVDSVVRYADIADDDKVNCAGTIDAYIRGAVGSA